MVLLAAFSAVVVSLTADTQRVGSAVLGGLAGVGGDTENVHAG